MGYILTAEQCQNFELSTRREWILTNGIGGFAMGTVAGVNTRRYHGQLVASDLSLARTVKLAGIEASVEGKSDPIGLSTNQYVGAVYPEGYKRLSGFRAGPWVEWTYDAARTRVIKRLAIHQGENTVTISYTNSGAKPIRLTLRPLVCNKFYHSNFSESADYPSLLAFPKAQTIVQGAGGTLHLTHHGARRAPVQGWYYRFEHVRELERGLPARDDLFCPCELTYELAPGEEALIVASAGSTTTPYTFEESAWDTFDPVADAAKHFIITADGRDTIIAGYPWFTDWGRDSMISLPGLCLSANNGVSKRIIRQYAACVEDGLIPNRSVERGGGFEYNTVDATLWFANTIYSILSEDWDETFARECFATLHEIVFWHQKGTKHGIRVDKDGLLTQGEEGMQLTWMDAKVGDWVVTPRHGKPVEVNGLWINLLRVAEWIAVKLGEPAQAFATAAKKAEKAFDSTFWNSTLGHYLDTADPDDASLRPNQLIPMALPFGPAKGENARAALGVITQKLLTPYGLRTLGPDEPGYRGRFKGTLPELDSAYHQGTVWPWLLGPYCDAVLNVLGDVTLVETALATTESMLDQYGLGGIAEVYDGDSPHTPGGCPWQAWSIAEILRIRRRLQAISLDSTDSGN